jgi:hypothetical protein
MSTNGVIAGMPRSGNEMHTKGVIDRFHPCAERVVTTGYCLLR